ncbi:asparagine synthase (glutamine-hydrolyzing) [Candidatus Nitronereus thalassa]|uniref:asparagine synthase (glutamine-hydrolyzing) n=1 Tax=Candidatus Nitronereus thalassa TaxID=3020898 RepID=A0ABU3K579_9BACT|nr:asparagine synthase (glutamine-hydrolyzing) [Candidatus Nitronereus thalassa]MDT7041562.1 asparagine synthase (glutamine-hydrolyzing) [Candidatus Nitronereus thalassa]
MCGIAGLFNLNGRPLDEPAIVKRMASKLVHRGPDEEGALVDGPVGFGFRRLRVIDLEAGTQPVSNEDGTIWVMFNGEIYNFKELRVDLQNRGHRFRTNSDTEVIVHAYETYGLDFTYHLRGMFAVALWDSQKRQVILTRDRIGKKPLFWSIHNHQLAFASEIKALLPWPGLNRALNARAIHDYLSFLYVPSPKSIFEHVHKLPPGHRLVACVDTGHIELTRYWQFQPEPDRGKSRKYFVDGLRSLLEESVRLRLRSDVPLGAFLSGGLDSTAVVGLMSNALPSTQVKTFSMGFQDKRFDETHYARIAARAYGTDHTEEIVGPYNVDLLKRLVWYLDEPFSDSSAIPTYQVSQIARKHVTVALSGDGGDELFAGYPRYQYVRWLRKMALLPKGLRHSLGWLSRAGYHLLEDTWRSGSENLRKLGKAIDLSALAEPERMVALLSYYDEIDKRALYSGDFSAHLQDYSSLTNNGNHLNNLSVFEDPIVGFMARDLETNLVDDSLVKVDRMSMACSLEVRCPLLDHKLVEFAGTIPPEMKLEGQNSKSILKEALADVLPQEIVNRGKSGFAVPFGGWFKSGEWKALLEDCLSSDSVKRRGLFDPLSVGKIRQAIVTDDGERALRISTHQLWHRVWTLVMFELWARQYLD